MTSYDEFLSPTGRELAESAIRRMGTVIARQPDMVSFAAGYPDPASFPWQELREIASELLSGSDPQVLQYGPTRGYAPLPVALSALNVLVGGAAIFFLWRKESSAWFQAQSAPRY